MVLIIYRVPIFPKIILLSARRLIMLMLVAIVLMKFHDDFFN